MSTAASRFARRCCRRRSAIAGLGLLALAAGCSEGSGSLPVTERVPALSLVRAGERLVAVEIVGPYGLRALQCRLTYDPGVLRPVTVEAGKDASRLDRVFFGDLSAAAGSLVLGLSDTRRVLLPARGQLVRIHLAPDAPSGATLRLEDPLGAREGGEPVALSLEVPEVSLP